jgi:hypothetical protein
MDSRLSVAKKGYDTFIPVEILRREALAHANPNSGRINVPFPNGIQLCCPIGIDIEQFKKLISFYIVQLSSSVVLPFNRNALSVNKLLQFGWNNPICI